MNGWVGKKCGSTKERGMWRNGALPSLDKEGWTRPQKNIAKPPCWERTGWFVQLPITGGLNEPPRLRELMWLREIFLIAQPPLLIQGGELASCDRSGLVAPLPIQTHPCTR